MGSYWSLYRDAAVSTVRLLRHRRPFALSWWFGAIRFQSTDRKTPLSSLPRHWPISVVLVLVLVVAY
jgi:hypothetical protein